MGIHFKNTELEEILEEIEAATEIHTQAQSHLKALGQKIDKIGFVE